MRDDGLHNRAYGRPDNELVRALEPDQIVAAAFRPLRVLVLIITALVIYTFVVWLR